MNIHNTRLQHRKHFMTSSGLPETTQRRQRKQRLTRGISGSEGLDLRLRETIQTLASSLERAANTPGTLASSKTLPSMFTRCLTLQKAAYLIYSLFFLLKVRHLIKEPAVAF